MVNFFKRFNLGELLDDRDLDVRTKVAEGLCKLMMSKVITSSKLFTRLILMWYNPVTNPNGRLRHVLGAFFPLYASMSKENQDSISEVRAFILISLSLKFVYILIHTECFISIYEVLLSVSNYVILVYFLMSLVAHCFRGVEFRIYNIEYLFWFFQVLLPEENNNKYSNFDMSKSIRT